MGDSVRRKGSQSSEQSVVVQMKSSESRWGSFRTRTGPLLAVLKELSEHLAYSGESEGDTRRGIFTELQSCAEGLVRIDREASERAKILAEIRVLNSSMKEGGEFNVPKVMEQMVDDRKKIWLDGDVGDDRDIKAMREFAKTGLGAAQGDDDGLIFGRQKQNVDKCPITLGEMVSPLRNDNCIHVYSTVGIVGYIARINKLRIKEPYTLDQLPLNVKATCPVAPCAQWVSRSTLSRDYSAELTQRQNLASQADVDLMEDINIAQ